MANQSIDFKDPGRITAWLEAALKQEKEKYERCPVMPNWAPGYVDAQAWGYVVVGYFLIEVSFKALLYVRGKQVPTKHSLSLLFDLFDQRDKTFLREFYADYRATIGGNRGAFPFTSLDDYLSNLDGDMNKRGDHIGSFDWRYFLVEEKRSDKMPLVSMDYLHEIVFGCIQVVRYARNGRFEPSAYTQSQRMRSKRQQRYQEWLDMRLGSEGWDELGDRLEILWGPDYRGRHDLYLFRGKGVNDYFSEIPNDLNVPIIDKRKEIEAFVTTKETGR